MSSKFSTIETENFDVHCFYLLLPFDRPIHSSVSNVQLYVTKKSSNFVKQFDKLNNPFESKISKQGGSVMCDRK